MDISTIALILAIIFFIAGLIGTILPILPGTVLIYIGMLLYGLITKFSSLDVYFFIIQGIALIVTLFIDNIASAVGTKRFGGSKQAAWGAIIGTILGVVIFGPLGIIVGPFLGAVAAEFLRGTEFKQTIRVGFGTLVGVIGGTVLKIVASIIMIVYFFMRI